MTSRYRFKLRQGTTTQWATANPVLLPGEPGVDLDLGVLKLGDGTTAWAELEPIGGGAPMVETVELFRSDYYIADPIESFGGSIVAGELILSAFAGAFAPGTSIMFDAANLNEHRGIWIAREDPGNPGQIDGVFTFAAENDQPYVTGHSGFFASFGIEPFTAQYINGVVRYSGGWSFTSFAYYVPADLTQWGTPPVTFAAALNRLAAAVSGLLGGPIP